MVQNKHCYWVVILSFKYHADLHSLYWLWFFLFCDLVDFFLASICLSFFQNVSFLTFWWSLSIRAAVSAVTWAPWAQWLPRFVVTIFRVVTWSFRLTSFKYAVLGDEVETLDNCGQANRLYPYPTSGSAWRHHKGKHNCQSLLFLNQVSASIGNRVQLMALASRVMT